MSNLTVSPGRRKPVHDENPHRSCEQSRPRPPRSLIPFHADPARAVTFPAEFLDRYPTKHEIQVFRILTEHCDRMKTAGIYEWPQALADELDISLRSVELALAKFQDWGLVVAEKMRIKGETRTVYWCRWCLLGGERIELDEGSPPRPPMAQIPRKKFAPTSSNPIQDKEPKTTDKESSSFVQCPERIPKPAPPPAPPIAEPIPIDPAIEAELLKVESPADRELVRDGAATWSAMFGVELVVAAIAVLRLKRAAGLPIPQPAGWFQGVLKNKYAERNAPGAAKAAAERQAAEARRASRAEAEARQAAEREAKRSGEAAAEREHAELCARWERLDASEREFIEGEARRRFAIAFRPGSPEAGRLRYCLVVLKEIPGA